ncbi:hypothetical protein DRO69_10285 [Candidatus Bathyarchaeota archaeon]|nr:MAG: hypothetical protein DRO69_10285 [Candidatus Bathyarchaeota archaeon]
MLDINTVNHILLFIFISILSTTVMQLRTVRTKAPINNIMSSKFTSIIISLTQKLLRKIKHSNSELKKKRNVGEKMFGFLEA